MQNTQDKEDNNYNILVKILREIAILGKLTYKAQNVYMPTRNTNANNVMISSTIKASPIHRAKSIPVNICKIMQRHLAPNVFCS